MNSIIESLTEDQENVVLKEVGYTRQQLKQDVEDLRQWLHQQQHLPPSRLTEKDEFLQMFLTGSKGSMETAKRKLDNYYTYRSNTELLESRDPLGPGYSQAVEMSCIGITSQVDKNITRIAYICLMDPDVEKFDTILHFRRFINLLEFILRKEGPSSSHIVVMDNKYTSAAHALRMRPLMIRDMIRLVEDNLPLRISGMYFINSPTYVETVFITFVTPFLSKKMKERIHVTSKGHEFLHELIEKSLLPKDYGGDYVSLRELSDTWRKYELEHREWFINELSEHTDESKRVNTGSNLLTDPYFGVHGSLKKLVID